MIVPHGSYLMNCGSPNEETRQKSKEMLADELQRCEKLGLAIFNFHPGSHFLVCLKFASDIWVQNILRLSHTAQVQFGTFDQPRSLPLSFNIDQFFISGLIIWHLFLLGSTCGKMPVDECLDKIAECIDYAHSKTKYVITGKTRYYLLLYLIIATIV